MQVVLILSRRSSCDAHVLGTSYEIAEGQGPSLGATCHNLCLFWRQNDKKSVLFGLGWVLYFYGILRLVCLDLFITKQGAQQLQ